MNNDIIIGKLQSLAGKINKTTQLHRQPDWLGMKPENMTYFVSGFLNVQNRRN
jgi:hypothetical protein